MSSGRLPVEESIDGRNPILPELSIDQYRAVVRTFDRWLKLKAKHEGYLTDEARVVLAGLGPDIDHSALLYRMLYERKEPLPEPPPLKYAYPDYEAVEGKR